MQGSCFSVFILLDYCRAEKNGSNFNKKGFKYLLNVEVKKKKFWSYLNIFEKVINWKTFDSFVYKKAHFENWNFTFLKDFAIKPKRNLMEK